MDDFIRRLNIALKNRGFSIRELAKRIDVADGTLKHILSGRPSYKLMDALNNLCEELEVSPAWLIAGTEGARVKDIHLLLKEIKEHSDKIKILVGSL